MVRYQSQNQSWGGGRKFSLVYLKWFESNMGTVAWEKTHLATKTNSTTFHTKNTISKGILNTSKHIQPKTYNLISFYYFRCTKYNFLVLHKCFLCKFFNHDIFGPKNSLKWSNSSFPVAIPIRNTRIIETKIYGEAHFPLN